MKVKTIRSGIPPKWLIVSTIACIALTFAWDSSLAADRKSMMKKGKKVYKEYCQTCHQKNGKGVANVYPPLYKSDFLKSDHTRNIRNLLFGLEGKIKVNKKEYNGVMPPIPDKYSDEDIAAVLTYVYNSFGNKGKPKKVVTVAEVAKVRKAGDPDAKKKKKKK